MAFLGEELGCFHDGQVAINTNACQQEDAAVKCGFLQAWNQFAHKCAEHPVAGVKVSSPEWESQGKEQVGDGQVHQVNVCRRPVVLHAAHYEDHHHVARQAQTEDYDINYDQNRAVHMLHVVWAGSHQIRVYVIWRSSFHV